MKRHVTLNCDSYYWFMSKLSVCPIYAPAPAKTLKWQLGARTLRVIETN